MSQDPAEERARAFRRDLTRRIAVSFSAGELSRYAERWRVYPDRDGGVDSGARMLVRALAGRRKLGELVASLRAHKPLVEWPDPPPSPTVEEAPASAELQRDTVEQAPLGMAVAPTVTGDDSEAESDEPDAEVSGERPAPISDSRAQRESVAANAARAARWRPRKRTTNSNHEVVSIIDPYLADPAFREPQSSVRAPRWWAVALVAGFLGLAVGAGAMYALHPARTTSDASDSEMAPVAAVARGQLERRVIAGSGSMWCHRGGGRHRP